MDARWNLPEVGGLSARSDTRQARFGDAVGAASPSARPSCWRCSWRAPNKPISRGDIFDRLWLDQGGASLNVVDVYIGYLARQARRHRPEGGGPSIVTVRGRGFMLEFVRAEAFAIGLIVAEYSSILR